MKVLCSAEIQCNEAGLVFLLCWVISTFFFMLSYCFWWFLFSLILWLSLAEMYAHLCVCEKWKRQNHALCLFIKRKSLALAKSKAVDLLSCYCRWLLIFYQALSYDKTKWSFSDAKRQYIPLITQQDLLSTTSQKSLFKETTSTAFSGRPGI